MQAAGLVWRLAFAMLLATSLTTLLGSRWEVLDLLAPFQFYFAAAWLLALGFFLVVRRVRQAFQHPVRTALAGAFLLLLHLLLLSQLFQPATRGSALPGAPARLEVVWFNMEHKAEALQALEAGFADGYPDLLALTETNRDTVPDPRLGLKYYLHSEPHRTGIWSRWPLEAGRAHAVPGERDAIDVTVVVAGQRLPVVAVHWRLPTRATQRGAARFLADLVSSRPDCLVLGDFNATPWSASLRLLEKKGGLWRQRLPFGAFNTWAADPWHLLAVPIDHVLLKGAVRVERLQILPWNVSDHRPLAARIAFSLPG